MKGYLLSRRFEKSTFVGANGVYIAFVNGLKTAVLSPLLFVGVGLGLALHWMIDQALFMKVVYVQLGVAGVKLIGDSLPALL